MQLMFGIEATVPMDHEWFQRLSVVLTDQDHEIYIVHTEEDAILIQQSLLNENLFEEKHFLIALEHPTKMPIFSDYGFVSESDQAYLLADFVCAFFILSGETQDIEMANYQIEEHLIVAEEWNEQTYYFVDKHQKELIQGFAEAYNIQVSFLDLDKWREND